MVFGEKLRTERNRKGWSQEELAEKLYVSRQAVSKWENGQNYPSIEIVIKISDLLELTIDELLRSDEELKRKVIKDGRKLAYPRLKAACDILFLVGAVLLALKLGVLALNKLTSYEVELVGGRFFWNFASLILMVGGGVGAGVLKEKYKTD
ncbi:helix-turn-helix domain-containing protein [Cohnella sp. GCM10012308]|uniref:helix-turn-helix domain-containing protein n=1 Tax=Cohnella sp. GCM10012308 TaxID=3317329 RepID=UPI003605B341